MTLHTAVPCPSCGADAWIQQRLEIGGHLYECQNHHTWALKDDEISHNHTITFDEAWRPDWDEYFLTIAKAVAYRADCRRAKFGAVIVDDQQRIKATGYNGAPRKSGSCLAGECPRGLLSREQQPSHADGVIGAQDFSNCISLHAEMNAVAYAGHTPGGVIYIASLDRPHCVPCDMCGKLIKAAGIIRVVCQ